MGSVEFDAFEVRAGGALGRAHYCLRGDRSSGFTIERDGQKHVEVGPGYTTLRTEVCGVCSTDLDRHHLPFPLPQVAGHELIGRDASGRRFAPEINATCRALGRAADCPYCSAGLERHCPDRLVLGIHDLPGGFGPVVLAPEGALVEVPAEVPLDTAVLIEPLAAAMRAVERVDLDRVRTVAVLGPKKLGMLVLAALASERRITGREFEITALLRRPELTSIALQVGADQVLLTGDLSEAFSCDLVIDTTGSAEGFEFALGIARGEVHLKSTNGMPAGGLSQATALVVDELSIVGFDARSARDWSGGLPVGWLSAAEPPSGLEVVRYGDPLRLRECYPAESGGSALGPLLVVADDLAMVDRVIRPDPSDQRAAVRPTGTIALTGGAEAATHAPLDRAIRGRGLRLSSSRCGDFRSTFERLVRDPELHGLGSILVTDRFPASEVDRAFDRARRAGSLKVLVEHPDPGR